MKEQWKKDYDDRQYGLMADHLQRFEEGVIDLGTLIAGLDALLETLEAPDQSWKSRVRSQWGMLEEVYAGALDSGESDLSSGDRDLVIRAVEEIRQLLANRKPT